ncbi:hypothetical protein GPJ56_001383 [Histomonas meleagridis]|uniref:uncharacterized protein n=1 Tax=Histomonas meleagridis TaxID=135588 RepID=UPI00355A3243|nr:hypothetical protein GPJ56_001383 [Histomonas meleagridis]KAH0798143.1 hypothetical protein GO595_008989 [Histomonas meleagridis]
MLPELAKNKTSFDRIQLIGFIIQCCDLGDIFSTRILVKNLGFIVFKGVEETVLTSFLLLLGKIISECGSSITEEMVEFAKLFLEMCSEKFLQTQFFPYFASFFERENKDVLALVISFVSKLMSKLSPKNINFFINQCTRLYKTKMIILKLAILNAFSDIVDYSQNPQELFNQIIVPSTIARDTRVKSNSLFVASKHINLVSDPVPFLNLAKDSSWKVRYAFLQNIGPFATTFPQFIPCLLSFLKDNMGFIRATSFDKASEMFSEIPKDDVFLRLVESALKQQNTLVILSALNLLPKLFECGAADPNKFVRFIQMLKSKDDDMVMESCLRCLVPHVNMLLAKKDINAIVKWIGHQFKTENWRKIGTVIETIEKFLEFENLHQVVLQFADNIADKLSDPCLHTRCASSSAILSMAKTFGSQFVGDRVIPHLKSIIEGGAPLDVKKNVYYILSELTKITDAEIKDAVQKEMDKVSQEIHN